MDNRLNQLAGLIEQLRVHGKVTYVSLDLRDGAIAAHILNLETSKFIMSTSLQVCPYGPGSYSYEFLLTRHPDKPWEVDFSLLPYGGSRVGFKDDKDANRLIALREMRAKLQTVLNLKA